MVGLPRGPFRLSARGSAKLQHYLHGYHANFALNYGQRLFEPEWLLPRLSSNVSLQLAPKQRPLLLLVSCPATATLAGQLPRVQYRDRTSGAFRSSEGVLRLSDRRTIRRDRWVQLSTGSQKSSRGRLPLVGTPSVSKFPFETNAQLCCEHKANAKVRTVRKLQKRLSAQQDSPSNKECVAKLGRSSNSGTLRHCAEHDALARAERRTVARPSRTIAR